MYRSSQIRDNEQKDILKNLRNSLSFVQAKWQKKKKGASPLKGEYFFSFFICYSKLLVEQNKTFND